MNIGSAARYLQKPLVNRLIKNLPNDYGISGDQFISWADSSTGFSPSCAWDRRKYLAGSEVQCERKCRRVQDFDIISEGLRNSHERGDHQIMFTRPFILILFWVVLASRLWSADSKTVFDEPVLTNETAKSIGRVYGFYVGQNFTLEAIERTFPEMAPQVKIAKLRFESKFGESIASMDAVLSRRGGEWGELRKRCGERLPRRWTVKCLL